MVDRATEYKWEHFVDGLPVEQELKTFMLELKTVMPNVWFIPVDHTLKSKELRDTDGTYQTTNSYRIVNEVGVCLDDFPFDLGRINFADNSVNNKGGNTYGVYSRKITNAKYATHRNQHHMIMGSDVKKAIKNAQKYLMPYSVKELAQAFYSPIRENVNSEFSSVQNKAQTLAQEVRSNYHAILEEIRALTRAGVTFKTEEFRKVANSVEEIYGEYEFEKNRKVGALFVRFYKVGADSYVTLQEAKDIKDSWSTATINGSPMGYRASELPQDVVGSVSVLSILNDGQYVANVGMRIDENHFWIERG
jgi:hypothetical protein